MNGTEKFDTGRGQEQDKDVLAELLRHAPSRKRAPLEDEQLIRQEVHSQWQDITRRRRRQRMVWVGAIAASLVLTTSIALRHGPTAGPAEIAAPLAIADKLVGTAMTRSAEGSPALLEWPPTGLHSNQTVLTGVESRLALRWQNGAIVRLDELTELELLSDTEIKLVSGRVYLDTASVDTNLPPITIHTPMGRVRHLGTQFITQVSQQAIFISVREGEVMYSPQAGVAPNFSSREAIAGIGQQLEISSDGSVQLEQIPTWGSHWEWTESVSPGFQSDGKSLYELLDWAGRETGRQVEYDTAKAETLAGATVLHGNLAVPPLQALEIATATSDLVAEVDSGLIRVSLSSPQ